MYICCMFFDVEPEEELLKEGEPRILTIFIFVVTDSDTVPALWNLVINVDAVSSDYLELSSSDCPDLVTQLTKKSKSELHNIAC